MQQFTYPTISLRRSCKLGLAVIVAGSLTTLQKSACAQVTFSLDTLFPTFMAPASGTATYFIDGHYSGLAGALREYGWSPNAMDATSDLVGTWVADDWTNWIGATSGVGDYSGHILSVTVAANQTPGVYDHWGNPSRFPLFYVKYLNSQGDIAITQDNYAVNITPYSPPTSSTPEPGAVGLLAGISLTGCYWLKMRRSRIK